MGHMAIAQEQIVDECGSLVRVGIPDEMDDLIGSRDAPHRIEVDATHEDQVA